MRPELLFTVATFATWFGWLALGVAAVNGLRALLHADSAPVDALRRSAVRSLVLGVALLLIAFTMPQELGRPTNGGWHVPLVWFLMPFPGWLVVVSAGFIVFRGVGIFLALSAKERRDRLNALLIWVAVGIGAGYWFSSLGKPIKTFRGAIPLSPTFVAIAVALGALAIVAMIAAERSARTRGMAKNGAIQLTLLAGCVVFGMPFAWLLVTSFKEDRDMSAAQGIVWVPKVQQMVPYDDPKRPLVETVYEGAQVRAIVDTRKSVPGGPLYLEVDRPLGLRGRAFTADESQVKHVLGEAKQVLIPYQGQEVRGFVAEDRTDGSQNIEILAPENLKGTRVDVAAGVSKPYRIVGLRGQNYTECLEWLPPETHMGLTYLRNTLLLVVLNLVGTILSSSLVAYGFSRLRFPGQKQIFAVMLSTMMLPGAVTMLPGFLINRALGWIDTLYPLWVGAFFAGAFNVFLLRQFFMGVPMELEDAAKIDGCTYLRTYWQVMMPQVKPALAVIAIWTFMGTWNNFMGPLIYISTPEKMPIAYAVQLFQGQRGGEYGLMMAFATMSTIPVLLLFFFCQRYFIEGVQLSGLGGR